jgi:hypothetical protein
MGNDPVGFLGFFFSLLCLQLTVRRPPRATQSAASSQQVFFFYLKRQLSQSIYSRL